MSKAENKLTRTLYRTFCPDSTELGEYQLGMLALERASFIQQHLHECPHCTRELAALQNYLADLAPELEYSLAERVKLWIAQLLPDISSGIPGRSPAFGLRGDPEKMLFYQAGEAQLTIEIQDDPDQPGRRALLGLLIGVDPTGLAAHLWQEGQEVTSVTLDELGNFIVAGLQPGFYQLILTGREFEIHVQLLKVI